MRLTAGLKLILQNSLRTTGWSMRALTMFLLLFVWLFYLKFVCFVSIFVACVLDCDATQFCCLHFGHLFANRTTKRTVKVLAPKSVGFLHSPVRSRCPALKRGELTNTRLHKHAHTHETQVSKSRFSCACVCVSERKCSLVLVQSFCIFLYTRFKSEIRICCI